MSKLIAGLLTTILLAAGLVAFAGSPASAACTRYGGCPATQTGIQGPAVKDRGESVAFSSGIRVVGSNAAPRGQVRIVVTGTGRRNNGDRAYVESKSARKSNFFRFGARFAPGKYSVRVLFFSNGSQDNSQSRTVGLKVRNRR